MNSPPSEADLPPPAAGPVRRALRRAKGVWRRHWRLQQTFTRPAGAGIDFVLLLLVPLIVLLALSADLLAFLFGGIVRAVLTCLGLFLALGLVLGFSIGDGAIVMLPMVMAPAGVLLGVILGFLVGPIFRELPGHFDREGSEAGKTAETRAHSVPAEPGPSGKGGGHGR